MPNNDYILRSDAATLISQLPAYQGSDGAWVNQKDVLDTLNVIPAVDVEPVRYGRWIPIHELKPDGYPLSVPTSFWCDQCKYSSESPRKFCPNCGAKMDAEPLKEKKDD